MKTIISASRRTDIPTFYWDWFQTQLKQQFVYVPNPLYPEKVSRVDLTPDDIHSIVLWSKNMSNVLKNPGKINDYNLYFQYTVTGYSKTLEPYVPSYTETMGIIEELLKHYNPKQFNIRFDPIILCPKAEEISYPGKDKWYGRLMAWELYIPRKG